ncbi:DUF454 family protein [Jiella sp. 40Bstr34]|uniref:DUF454 family protein n=2 Tax=Jiella pacifica TaxID=2696469 RepID=A0A6N9TBZ1_9HYPH|nr:YbaN family protein [Jiella pacifica]NDW07586.1 DUF454 family protein [Jiella pacifica]
MPRPIHRSPLHQGRRAGFFALGCLMLLFGFVGALLPVMPTTIFLILAAGCFGRSSPRLETWLLQHPQFGPVLRDWQDHGTMPRRAKAMAFAGMAVGYALFWSFSAPATWIAAVVAAPMIACAFLIARWPERPTSAPPQSHEGETGAS